MDGRKKFGFKIFIIRCKRIQKLDDFICMQVFLENSLRKYVDSGAVTFFGNIYCRMKIIAVLSAKMATGNYSFAHLSSQFCTVHIDCGIEYCGIGNEKNFVVLNY